MPFRVSDSPIARSRRPRAADSDRALSPAAGIALGLILSLFCWTVLVAGAVILSEFL